MVWKRTRVTRFVPGLTRCHRGDAGEGCAQRYDQSLGCGLRRLRRKPRRPSFLPHHCYSTMGQLRRRSLAGRPLRGRVPVVLCRLYLAYLLLPSKATQEPPAGCYEHMPILYQ